MLPAQTGRRRFVDAEVFSLYLLSLVFLGLPLATAARGGGAGAAGATAGAGGAAGGGGRGWGAAPLTPTLLRCRFPNIR